MKKTGTVYKGPAKPKADVTLMLSDESFTELAAGKVSVYSPLTFFGNLHLGS